MSEPASFAIVCAGRPGRGSGGVALRVVGIAAFVVSLPMSTNWTAPYALLLLRLLLVGLAGVVHVRFVRTLAAPVAGAGSRDGACRSPASPR